MEIKKSPKADLENKKDLFFEIGMILSLGIIVIIFNLHGRIKPAHSLQEVSIRQVEEEIIPITRTEELKITAPPPPPPKAIEILNIVDDKVVIEDELEILESEANKTTKVELTQLLIAQTAEKEKEEEQVFVVVEEMPEFPGGELNLRKYIANAIKYPTVAQETGIQGTVYVGFVVDRDGSITGAKIIRGVDPALDKEAIRVINTLPKWKPGRQRGKPVRVAYNVPIHFVLQ